MKLRHSARTDVGKTRDHNEDDFGVGEGAGVQQYGELLVVCDGMGGHAAGEVASRLGVETILSSYYGDTSADRIDILRVAFERANQRIHAEGRGAMGTTGVAALLIDGMLHIANVGDSRGYLVRGDEIRQISRDHSLVGEQVAAGVITADQARSIYYRNVITRALGYQADVLVDLFHIPLEVGDTIVLCSDGLHGLVEDEEIREVVQGMPLADAVDRLIDMANERGGTDNITAVIAHIDALDLPDTVVAERDAAEQSTVELPVTMTARADEPDDDDAPLPEADLLPEQAPPAIAPAPTRAAVAPAAEPRQLNWRGALLAILLFAVLGFVILFVLNPSVLAPGPATPPATAEAPPATAPPPTEPPPTAIPPTNAPATTVPAVTVAPSATTEPSATSTAQPSATPEPSATALPTIAASQTPIPLSAPTASPTPSS